MRSEGRLIEVDGLRRAALDDDPENVHPNRKCESQDGEGTTRHLDWSGRAWDRWPPSKGHSQMFEHLRSRLRMLADGLYRDGVRQRPIIELDGHGSSGADSLVTQFLCRPSNDFGLVGEAHLVGQIYNRPVSAAVGMADGKGSAAVRGHRLVQQICEVLCDHIEAPKQRLA